MDTSRDQWLARCALAVCAASRWGCCVSLALSALALGCLYFYPAGPVAAGAISLAAAAGAVHAYLAARIEFDRAIFRDIAAVPDAAAAAVAFDAAAQQAGLLPAPKAGRSLVQRLAGVTVLAKASFGVLLVQLVLLIVAAWMER